MFPPPSDLADIISRKGNPAKSPPSGNYSAAAFHDFLQKSKKPLSIERKGAFYQCDVYTFWTAALRREAW